MMLWVHLCQHRFEIRGSIELHISDLLNQAKVIVNSTRFYNNQHT